MQKTQQPFLPDSNEKQWRTLTSIELSVPLLQEIGALECEAMAEHIPQMTSSAFFKGKRVVAGGVQPRLERNMKLTTEFLLREVAQMILKT
ncbi:hypothetical protein ACVA51_13430 [Pseudomonas luteola]